LVSLLVHAKRTDSEIKRHDSRFISFTGAKGNEAPVYCLAFTAEEHHLLQQYYPLLSSAFSFYRPSHDVDTSFGLAL
jgi:hypothetical protein